TQSLSLTELQQLATRTKEPAFLDGFAKPPPILGGNDEAEARLAAGQVAPELLYKVEKTQEQLALLGIQRSAANLLRHFEQLAGLEGQTPSLVSKAWPEGS